MIQKTPTATKEGFQQWVSLYADDLYRWALHKVPDRETAQDLVQDTFFSALKAIEKYEGKSQPKTWLFAILNHKILDHYRKSWKKIRLDSAVGTADVEGPVSFFDEAGNWKPDMRPIDFEEIENHPLDDPEFTQVFHLCLGELPGHWFSAIHLKYLSGKAGKEICQELGITPSNFWQILHRAKLQLRLCIEKKWAKS